MGGFLPLLKLYNKRVSRLILQYLQKPCFLEMKLKKATTGSTVSCYPNLQSQVSIHPHLVVGDEDTE